MNTQLHNHRLPHTPKILPPQRKRPGAKPSPFDPVAYAAALEVLG